MSTSACNRCGNTDSSVRPEPAAAHAQPYGNLCHACRTELKKLAASIGRQRDGGG